MRFRDLPTIWRGGWKRRRRSGRASSRLIDATIVCILRIPMTRGTHGRLNEKSERRLMCTVRPSYRKRRTEYEAETTGSRDPVDRDCHPADGAGSDAGAWRDRIQLSELE